MAFMALQPPNDPNDCRHGSEVVSIHCIHTYIDIYIYICVYFCIYVFIYLYILPISSLSASSCSPGSCKDVGDGRRVGTGTSAGDVLGASGFGVVWGLGFRV